MTEAEWLTYEDAMQMLRSVQEKVSHRKGGLFKAACLRRLWDNMSERGRSLVEEVENYAENPELPDANGEALEYEIDRAMRSAPQSLWGGLRYGLSGGVRVLARE